MKWGVGGSLVLVAVIALGTLAYKSYSDRLKVVSTFGGPC